MLSGAVATALSRVRRGVAGEGGGARHGFTVARTEALLRLRDVPRAPWAWTLGLLRAARSLSTSGRAVVEAKEEGDERVVTLRFGVGGCDLAGAELRGVLHATVGGEEERGAAWMGELGRRWRAEVGAAINAGLASGPRSIAVRTATDGRAYVRRDSQVAGQDPYAEQPDGGRCVPQSFEVVLREARPGAGRRLAAWLARQTGAAAAIEGLWREALFLAPGQTGMVELADGLPGPRVVLGEHAVWGPVAGLGGPWLVRGGVRALSLAPALAVVGLAAGELAGWVECPGLRLTADEAGVVQDGAFDLLVAWLLDARAHAVTTTPGGPNSLVVSAVVWKPAEQVRMASGRVVDQETMRQRARTGRDFLYVWRHQEKLVPPAMQPRTHVLWPSELAALRVIVPELRPVPVRALGDAPQVERVDLTSLTQASLPAVEVELAAGTATTQGGARVELQLRAFVHRTPTATSGETVLLAYGRKVAHVRESARVVPGVTLVCELHGAEMDALRGEAPLLQSLADRCREAGERVMPMLLAQGMAHASPWEVPLVRARAEGLTGAALGLRYREDDDGPRLAWDESPLLGLVVGRAGAEAVTLLRALERCRDEGGIVVEDPRQAWPGWASREPGPGPWVLTVEGRGLVARVIGKDVLWDMPTLPEMHARPGAGRGGTMLAAEEVARLSEKPDEESRRAALLAHLLGARAAGRGDEVLAELPLVRRFDPRALTPVRKVSLTQALAEEPRAGLLPMGAVTRELAGAALLVTPGEAWLLRAEGFVAAGRPLAGGVASVASAVGPTHARPQRRAGPGSAVLVVPVASAVAVGALRVEGTAATTVALWSGGLHLDDVQLPAPLDCVGGRLVLTRQGARVSGDRLGGEIRGMCRTVVMQALEQRRLHRPGGSQQAALAGFIARCEEAAAAGAAPLIADLLAPRTGADEVRLGVRLGVSLQRHPLERLPPPGPRRLESFLRQALARPLGFGSAILSWQVATLARVADVGWEVELGKRNGFVQRALAEQPGAEDPAVAAALAVAALFSAARAGSARESGLVDEWVADYRLLALVYAHAP